MRNGYCLEWKKWIQGRNKTFLICCAVCIAILFVSKKYNMLEEQEQKGLLKIGVVNEDGSVYSSMLVNHFKTNETFSSLFDVISEERTEIETMFSKGNLSAYLVIPKNFTKDLMNLDNRPISVTIDSSNTTNAILIKTILNSYESYIKAVEVNVVAFQEAMNQSNVEQLQLEKANETLSYQLIMNALGREKLFEVIKREEYPSYSLDQYYSYAILFLLIQFISFSCGLNLLSERKQGIKLRVKLAGASTYSYIQSKLLFFASMISIIVIIANFIFFHIPIKSLLLILFGIVTAFLFCYLFQFIASELLKREQVYFITSITTIFFCMVLGGTIIPVTYFPERLVLFSKCTPNYWFVRKMLQLTIEDSESFAFLSFIICFFLSYGIFYLFCNYFDKKGET